MLADKYRRLCEALWDIPEQAPASQRRALMFGRYLFALLRDLMGGQLSMRAMSLVYTTLLSIVPMLALAFSVLKALGAHNSLEPVLHELLRPLGAQGLELSANLVRFVDRMEVGVLGSVGVGMLFYTALALIQKVESSFNFIWGIERLRPLAKRVGEYLAMLLFGPVVAFAVLAFTASILQNSWLMQLTADNPLGSLLAALYRLVPYALIIGFFTFIYAYIPNTRVRLKPALAAGMVAGLLWQTGSLVFASFVRSATQYNAIYSSFAILIFLLIWLYLGWLVVLIGCRLAFYLQYPQQLLRQPKLHQISGRAAEILAVTVMGIVGQRLLAGLPPASGDALDLASGADPSDVDRVVRALLDAGLLIEAGEDAGGLMPARDLGSLTIAEILLAIRRTGAQRIPQHPYADAIAAHIDAGEANLVGELGPRSLRDWLLDQTPASRHAEGTPQASGIVGTAFQERTDRVSGRQ